MGYASKTVHVNPTRNLEVFLQPIEYQMEEVVVNNLTWSELFLLDAVKRNEETKKALHYYTADAYSKTVFTNSKLGIGGLTESISQIQYLEPDLFKEKVLVFKISPNMKALPYEFIAVNQKINLTDQSAKIWSFFIISPLNKQTLKYYNIILKRTTMMDADTVVVLEVSPKNNSVPLFEGELYFLLNSHRLLEADLRGNQKVKDAMFDSLKLYQKYSIMENEFNLPSFTTFSLNMNVMGLRLVYRQDYTFMNYSINNASEKPFITAENLLVEEPNLAIDLDFKRDEIFKVPVTSEEQKFNEKMQRIFIDAPFYRKILLFAFTNLIPYLADEPVNIAGLNFSKFSNLYRFNKTEGNYLGLEYTIHNNDYSNIYSKVGYAFEAAKLEYDFHLRWKYLSLNINDGIKSYGGFEYLQSYHSLNALFFHSDDIHYYGSTRVGLKYRYPLSGRVTITPAVSFERQRPIENKTEFSLFSRDKSYLNNYQIFSYLDNNISLQLEYIENSDFAGKERVIYSGQSFTNITASVKSNALELLKATENTTEWNLDLYRYQEIYAPVKIKLNMFLRYLNNTGYMNRMSFVNNSEIFNLGRNPLTFYTLNNYDFYLKNFLRITSDITLFDLPSVLGFQMSVGGFYSFLRPLNQVSLSSPFPSLSNNFMEYGAVLKGVSLLDIYFLKNTLHPDAFYVRIDFSR